MIKVKHDVWHLLEDGKFHHYNAVSENGITKYYVDGEFVNSSEETKNSKNIKS